MPFGSLALTSSTLRNLIEHCISCERVTSFERIEPVGLTVDSSVSNISLLETDVDQNVK